MEEEGADAWGIALLSLAMLIGCFIAGSVPLSISLSESKTRFLAVLGAGLLVGTSLAVIIPEGIHSMYENKGHQPCEDDAKGIIGPENNPGKGDVQHADAEEHVHTHAHGGVEDQHYMIGVALVVGFVFMLCVDQIGGGSHSHSVSPLTSDQEVSSRASPKSITATLGLVVHAAADGIAMGAAATASGADIQMIVFIAIMLHKAPAAFGLVTFLMHENYERNRIRKHLLVFSLAAPVVALLSYFSLSHASKAALVSVNATGLSMLFSAGTFLYVATVHVLPEIVAMKHHHTLPTDQGSVTEVKQGLKCSELTALVCSCMAPLVLAMGHHH